MKHLRSFSSSIWLCILFFTSCAIDSFDQLTDLPVITSAIPQVLSAENPRIELQLSRPVINHRNMETCFRFAKSKSVTPAMLKRAEKSKSSELASPFLQSTIALSGSRDKIIIIPREKLEYGESYSLFLFRCFRDDMGAPLAPTTHEFVVEAAPFRIISQDIILPSDSLAMPGRKYFHFRFSHPLSEVPPIVFGDLSTQTSLSEDGRELLVELKDGLRANTTYQVSFAPLLREPIVFTTAAENFKPRASLLQNLQIISYESHIVVEASVPHLYRLSARIGEIHVQGKGALIVEGLDRNKQYDYTIEVENLFGDRETKIGKVTTRRVANVTINEIMANPKLQKRVSDSVGEYIELFNFGDEAVNLTGFTIEVDGKPCSLTSGKRLVILPAKSLMILVGKKFDVVVYDLPENSAIFRMPTQTVCGNLRNWPLPSIILRDETGRKISHFSGMPSAKEKGFSVERLNPSEKHGKEQYCYSRTDVGPTPLRMNGISEKGCE